MRYQEILEHPGFQMPHSKGLGGARRFELEGNFLATTWCRVHGTGDQPIQPDRGRRFRISFPPHTVQGGKTTQTHSHVIQRSGLNFKLIQRLRYVVGVQGLPNRNPKQP